MTALFSESDRDRLVRRIAALTAGDLTAAQISRLVDGDMGLLSELPSSGKQKIAALVTPARRGELEKIVGTATAFVPIAFLERARASARAVARVIDGRRRPLGTGVMVSPRLFMTNHHVLPDARTAASCSAQFDYQLGIDDVPDAVTEFRFDPASFFWTSPIDQLDTSLVAMGQRITGDESLERFGWAPMSSAADKHATGDFVTVIQHPDADYKQIALRENRVVGRGKGGVTVYYTADTRPGSSGSPVFNDELALVALHHAGGPRNDTLLEDGREVPEASNEGIRISSIVNALRERHDILPAGLRDLLAEVLNPPVATQPALESIRADVPAGLSGPGPMVVSADLHLPRLHIITGGHAVGAAASDSTVPEPDVAATSARNDAPDQDYASRRGYDPKFLAQPVAMPTVATRLIAKCALPQGLRRSQANVVLRYHHFSAVVRADRRMPLFTMVNVDGRRTRTIDRVTGEAPPAEMWFLDRRLAADHQLSGDVFDLQSPQWFDRAPLVRRLDPAWGSPAAAKLAADDTFHYTNCCPQIAAVDQDLWQGIENYALECAGAEKHRITVVSGPVFGRTDPAYRGIEVPRSFWKIVVRIGNRDGRLRATGFVADQGAAMDGTLAAAPEAFVGHCRITLRQESIAAIEALTRLSFGGLRDHDTARAGLESTGELTSLDEARWDLG